MKKRVRNEADDGPAAEGAVITYSRLPKTGGRGPAERQEPFLEAREVPYGDDELRAYDPERAAVAGLGDAVDDLDAPRRGRTRRRGEFGVVLVGALALAAGMVILAYAYGVATRVDAPPPSAGAAATVPADAGGLRTSLPANDAAQPVPSAGDASVPMPQAAPPARDTAALPPAAAPAAPGADGTPMDGDVGQPTGGAQPALVAPVPTTTTPAAAKAPAAKAASVKPADSTDDLMAHIESLLAHDVPSADASAQPGASGAASAQPTPIAPTQPTALNAPPLLPDPNAVADAPTPPADVGARPANRLIPPADIPNVPTTNTGSGLR